MDPQVSQRRSGVHVRQLTAHDRPQHPRNYPCSLRILTVEDVFGRDISERLNHQLQLYPTVEDLRIRAVRSGRLRRVAEHASASHSRRIESRCSAATSSPKAQSIIFSI